MKSLIVFYIPSESIPLSRKGVKQMVKGFEKRKPDDADMILIEDPTIKHVKIEVHFNPYQ